MNTNIEMNVMEYGHLRMLPVLHNTKIISKLEISKSIGTKVHTLLLCLYKMMSQNYYY